MDVIDFWRELRKRRRIAMWWFVLWVPCGAMALLMYHAAFGTDPPIPFVAVLPVLWVSVGTYLSRRATGMLCPICGRPAIEVVWWPQHTCIHCRSSVIRP
jgi:hypothetical protein